MSNKPSGVGRYTKQPVTISAIQWTGDNLAEVIQFTGRSVNWGGYFGNWDEYAKHVAKDGYRFKIFTAEGVMVASKGDWVIKGVNGENYPCKPDIFAKTYRPADDQTDLEWAVARWNAEVANRPLGNVHRRSLDDVWRQVITRLGGDPVALLGPSHDDLVNWDPDQESQRQTGQIFKLNLVSASVEGSDGYLLQRNKAVIGNDVQWWREGGGYTSHLGEARVFGKDEVDAILKATQSGDYTAHCRMKIAGLSHQAVDSGKLTCKKP